MIQDLRQAVRTLRRNPAFTIVAVVTLALGIGANTAFFSVADAVLLRPLPYPDADRVFRIAGAPFGFSPRGMTVAKAVRESPLFAGIGLYASGALNVAGEPAAERVRAAAVSAGFFAALGARPAAGRVFTDEEAAATPQVAVVSDGFWRRRFGTAADAVNRTILLNGRAFVLVGVMPARFDFPALTDVWIPAGSDSQITGRAFAPAVVGRLAAGVMPEQARAGIVHINDVRSGGARDPRETPVELVPLGEELVGSVRPLILVVSAAVLLVLLIACINTANLLLARVSARDREIAVRRALGATSGRLVRSLLCESAVLSFIAGVVAVPAAILTLHAIRVFVPPTLHGAAEMAIDGRAIAATGLLCLVATLLFGAAPAVSLPGAAAGDRLRGSTATTAGPFWRRFRSVLVVAEIAMALVLLAGAAAIVRTVATLMRIDLGARGERVLTMETTLPIAKYASIDRIAPFAADVQDRLHALPGVISVGLTSLLPGSHEIGIGGSIEVDGAPVPTGDDRFASELTASPEYFDTLGIDLVAGRTFKAADRAGAPPVAIVSERLARSVGLEAQAIVGRRLKLGFRRERYWGEIVGVVRDVRLRGPESPVNAQYYVPFEQVAAFGTTSIAIRTAADPRTLAASLRREIAAIDPDLPLYNVRTFDDIRRAYVSDRRFAMTLMLAFGGLAGTLAAIGLYGVLAYLLQLRTREFGIRLALGASPGSVRWQIVRGGLRHAMAGIAAGSAVAVVVSRVLESRLPAVQRVDAATLAALGGAMCLLAIAAAWIPSRRATRIDPVETLRAD